MGEFRLVLTEKSTGRTVLPETQKLAERIFAGLKHIAKRTIPLRLATKVTDYQLNTFPVFRRIDYRLILRFPVRPIAEDSTIDMDDELIDALALFVMAGLERGNAKTHMGMYYGEIDDNNERLIETVMVDGDNEGEQPWV